MLNCRTFCSSLRSDRVSESKSKDSQQHARNSGSWESNETTHDEKYRGIVRRPRRNDRAARDRRTECPGCAFRAGESVCTRELDARTARPAGTDDVPRTRTVGGAEG